METGTGILDDDIKERMDAMIQVPVSALVLYRNKQGRSSVENWRIEQGRLVDPRPVLSTEIQELYKAVRAGQKGGSKSFHGLVPKGTVLVDKCRMMFIIPPSRRTLLLERKDGLERADTMLPEMLFDYHGPAHTLYAYWSFGTGKGKRFMSAPMPNISDGFVCLGTSMKKVQFVPEMQLMQQRIIGSFFGSTFNEWRDPIMGTAIATCMKLAGHGRVKWDPLETFGVKFDKLFRSSSKTLLQLVQK